MVQITPHIFHFLKEIEKNNNKLWFKKNENLYKKTKNDFEIFVTELLSGIALFDSFALELSPKKCIFRIYRDARFSKNKTPYKINFGAHMLPGGKKAEHSSAGYYVHIEPGNCFLAGGAYLPPADWLSSIRENINEHAKDFRKIITEPNFKKSYGEIRGAKLKTAPRGYEKDNPNIDLLNYKSFLAVHTISDKQALSKNFLEYAATKFKILKPFDDFLNGK